MGFIYLEILLFQYFNAALSLITFYVAAKLATFFFIVDKKKAALSYLECFNDRDRQHCRPC